MNGVWARVRFMDADSNSIYQLGSTACYLLLPIKAKIKENERREKRRFHFFQLPPRMGLIIAQGLLLGFNQTLQITAFLTVKPVIMPR